MTRKHYTDMANRFANALDDIAMSQPAAGRNARLAVMKGVGIAIDAYCQHAQADNPAFDKDRFLNHIAQKRQTTTA